jgi:hypothetical protein
MVDHEENKILEDLVEDGLPKKIFNLDGTGH